MNNLPPSDKNWLYFAFGSIAMILLTSVLLDWTVKQLNKPIESFGSETRAWIRSLNRSQQAYFLEKNSWAQSLDILDPISKPSNDNYRYNTQVVNSIRTVNINNYRGVAIQTGIAKIEKLKSYVGVAYFVVIPSGKTTIPDELSTSSILCESNEPTNKESGLPKFDSNGMQCPDGYRLIK